jgi:hypothetical protein
MVIGAGPAGAGAGAAGVVCAALDATFAVRKKDASDKQRRNVCVVDVMVVRHYSATRIELRRKDRTPSTA